MIKSRDFAIRHFLISITNGLGFTCTVAQCNISCALLGVAFGTAIDTTRRQLRQRQDYKWCPSARNARTILHREEIACVALNRECIILLHALINAHTCIKKDFLNWSVASVHKKRTCAMQMRLKMIKATHLRNLHPLSPLKSPCTGLGECVRKGMWHLHVVR